LESSTDPVGCMTPNISTAMGTPLIVSCECNLPLGYRSQKKRPIRMVRGKSTPVLVLVAALLFNTTSADMYDVLLPHYQPPTECAHGCAAWDSLPKQTNALWAADTPLPNASNHCAILAAAVDEPPLPPNASTANNNVGCGGMQLGDLVCNGTTSSFYGPICACDMVVPLRFATCTAPVRCSFFRQDFAAPPCPMLSGRSS
jgi:hypothetical protein